MLEMEFGGDLKVDFFMQRPRLHHAVVYTPQGGSPMVVSRFLYPDSKEGQEEARNNATWRNKHIRTVAKIDTRYIRGRMIEEVVDEPVVPRNFGVLHLELGMPLLFQEVPEEIVSKDMVEMEPKAGVHDHVLSEIRVT